MKQNFDNILSEGKILVVDGAFATELERFGCDLNDELWSAKVLAEDPDLIKKVHIDYFKAGADCGISASYQATVKGFMKKGYTEERSKELIKSAVTLLIEAREQWWSEEGESGGRMFPLVTASVGPYGAYLSDGSEYVGNYGVGGDELRDFHKERMALLKEAGAELFAIETVPCLEEAVVASDIARELKTDCWVSFTCQTEDSISEGTPIKECAKKLAENPYVKAIGINCSDPNLVKSLIGEIKSVVSTPIVVYPNNGEVYDAVTKTWDGNDSRTAYSIFADMWLKAGATLIGGCCRTKPSDIADVYELIKKRRDSM